MTDNARLVPIAIACMTALLLPPSDAEACSFISNSDFAIDADQAAVDTQPPSAPTEVIYNVNRFEDSGCAAGNSCEGTMTVTLDIQVADDQTSNADLGFLVRVVDGDVPIDIPVTAVGAAESFTDGESRLFFFWQSEDATSGTLEITPIDRAGNMGQPILVEISDPGTGGCRVANRGGLGAWLLSLLGLALITRRRR